jgi:hypothetical protein
MIEQPLGSVIYYGSLLLFLAAFVLTAKCEVHGLPVAGPGRETSHISSMDVTEIEGEGTSKPPKVVGGVTHHLCSLLESACRIDRIHSGVSRLCAVLIRRGS